MGTAIPLAYQDDEDEELPKPKAQPIPLATATKTALPMGTPATQATTPTVPLSSAPPALTLAPSTGAGNLVGQTITPGTGIDRIALANRAADQFADATRPQFERDLRSASQRVAGRGQLGSGMERGAFADLTRERTMQLDLERQSMVNKAIADSIADQYANIAIAQQQQGFQASREDAGRTFGLQEGQLDLARETGLGSLDLARQAEARAGRTADAQIGLAERAQSLSETLGLGNLSMDQARLALQEKVANGELSIAEADQALREKAQGIQQDQFAQQLAQALEIATMSDKTQNRQVDAQAALANNELLLRVAQLLASMGYSTTNKPPGNNDASNPNNVPPDEDYVPPPPDEDAPNSGGFY